MKAVMRTSFQLLLLFRQANVRINTTRGRNSEKKYFGKIKNSIITIPSRITQGTTLQQDGITWGSWKEDAGESRCRKSMEFSRI